MEDEGRRRNKFRNGADVVVGRQRPEAAQGADIRVEDPRRRRGASERRGGAKRTKPQGRLRKGTSEAGGEHRARRAS